MGKTGVEPGLLEEEACSLLVQLLRGFDDGGELILARSAADQEAIHIGHCTKLLAVLGVYGAAIEDAHCVCHLVAAEVADDGADLVLRLLRLHGCCYHSGADSPHRLVCDGHLAPVGDLWNDGRE